MSTPNNTDLLLVERGGSQYKLPYSDLNNKLDTDVFLVERGGVQYKVLGEFIGGASIGTVSAAPVLSDDNDSKVPAVITLTNATVGNATLTSNVWLKDGVVIAGVTGSTYSATDPGVYSIKQTWTDGLGNTFQVEAQLELRNLVYVDDLFSTFLYEGTYSTQSINNGIDLSGEGGLVWIKNRSAGYESSLFDTERGAGQYLVSNASQLQVLNTGRLSSFNSDGFTIGDDPMTNDSSNSDFVSWTFRKAPGFLDIVQYTGDGDINKTVSHSLGSVPGMIIVKKTSGSGSWYVWHRELGGTGKALQLDSTASTDTNYNLFSTLPTASVFSPGDNSHTNQYGQTYIAYIFAHDDQSFGANGDEAIIKCGTYTGTGGELNVDLGFEAQFVLVKNIDNGSSNWIMFDNMRGMDDGRRIQLYPNSAEAEFSGLASSTPGLVATATGFKTDLGNSWFNQSGSTHIYMAIRRSHKPPTVGTDVFAMDYFTGTTPNYISNFPVDFVINREGRFHTAGYYVADRLRGGKFLKAQQSSSEIGAPAATFDHMNGFSSDGGAASSEKIAWMFKRASGFMDVVSYTGNGSARTIPHNLNATPSVVLVKGRDTEYQWYWYHYALGANHVLQLNNMEIKGSHGQVFNDTLPTSSVFSIGSLAGTNMSGGEYIAYLFADLDGVSKAGVYTGTGYQIDVDCGFTTGARFVMIKRTDSNGNWYVWDTQRGLFGPPEPYLKFNSTDPEVSGYDYVDPYSAGFTVTSTAPAEINAAGGEYVFLAIA